MRPIPSPEQIEAITASRQALTTATDRRHRDPGRCERLWQQYTAACQSAGVRTPAPWSQWPVAEDAPNRRPAGRPHNSGRHTAGNERNTP